MTSPINLWNDIFSRLVIPFLVVLALAIGYNLQLRSGLDASVFGLHPGDSKQWWGILTSPLVHGSLAHLLSNIIALIGLLSLLFVFYDKVAALVLPASWILTGTLMYFFARPGFFHIGASGVAYAITFYLFLSGLLSGDRSLRIISMLVALYYGSMVWGLFPLDPTVSWDGHAAGAAAGVLLSVLTYKKYHIIKVHPTEWETEEDFTQEDEYEKFDR